MPSCWRSLHRHGERPGFPFADEGADAPPLRAPVTDGRPDCRPAQPTPGSNGELTKMLQGLALRGFLDQIGQKQKTSSRLPHCTLSRGWGPSADEIGLQWTIPIRFFCKYLCIHCRIPHIALTICTRNRSKSTTTPNRLCMVTLATHRVFGRILIRKRSEPHVQQCRCNHLRPRTD